MNIFLRELRANFKSLLIWGGIVTGFAFMGLAEFSAYYDNPDILKVINGLPQPILEALNVGSFNLTTITGFFGIMFTYFALILATFAVMLGNEIISKEERDKTAEFSLAFPVSRARVVTAKILAAVVNCIILALITWGVNVAFAQRFSPGDDYYEFIALCALAFLMIEIIFLAMGVLLASVIKEHKRSSSMAISLILAAYFFSILSSLSDKLEFLKYFSPIRYFDPAYLYQESKFETEFIWLSLGITMIAIMVAYVSYSKRDLNL